MFLVSNLKNSRYLREVYGSPVHLGERFAKVSPDALAGAQTLFTRSAGLPSSRKDCGQQYHQGALVQDPSLAGEGCMDSSPKSIREISGAHNYTILPRGRRTE